MSQVGVFRVDLQPVGRRAEIAPGQTLLDAARAAGVEVVSLCGGEGWCHSCVVRLASGIASQPSHSELDTLSREEIAAGFRLACQTQPMSDVIVEIPPDSLTAQQRLSIEGAGASAEIDPVVVPVDITLSPPTLYDLRSDAARLEEALGARGIARPIFPLSLLTRLSEQLRSQEWRARIAVRPADDNGEAKRAEIVAALPPGRALLGLAVDIGTTKLAAYLVDLDSGQTVASAGAMNPQIAFGEDVISRIGYCSEHPAGRQELQARMAEALNALVGNLCQQVGADSQQVVEAVVVGNTAMHHLFAGLPVKQLAGAPYVPAISAPMDLRSAELGLDIAPAAFVHLPPNIAGFVGADHVAMALATGAWETERTLIALDIGTNTEVTLARRGRIWCCSCASGPAFEGAHVQDGMRAAPGAIERIQITGDGRSHLLTIDNQPPIGICGSGILDAVSELFRAGIIDRRGVFRTDAPNVNRDNGISQFVLAPAEITGHGRPVVITRKDINEIQLAKAAIRTGVDVLLHEAGIGHEDVEEFIVAGAFGTYLDVASCVRIGMFPHLPPERFRQVGNAAGAGARQMLVSAARRKVAMELARQVTYVELTVHPNFERQYLKALSL